MNIIFIVRCDVWKILISCYKSLFYFKPHLLHIYYEWISCVCVFCCFFFHWAAYVSICSRFLIIFRYFLSIVINFGQHHPSFYGYRLFLLRKSVKSKASSTVFKRTEWSLLWILQASYENLKNKSSIEARKFHNLY